MKGFSYNTYLYIKYLVSTELILNLLHQRSVSINGEAWHITKV